MGITPNFRHTVSDNQAPPSSTPTDQNMCGVLASVGHLPLGCQGHVPDLLSCSSLPRPPEKAHSCPSGEAGGRRAEGVKCPGDEWPMLGSLVTLLLSCSPAKVPRVPGNRVNSPDIVEEDKFSISRFPGAVRQAPSTTLTSHPPAQCFRFCWGPPEHHSRNSPAAQGLSGDGLWAAHTAALRWADSPSFPFSPGRG